VKVFQRTGAHLMLDLIELISILDNPHNWFSYITLLVSQ
jgi:hypothetical protein